MFDKCTSMSTLGAPRYISRTDRKRRLQVRRVRMRALVASAHNIPAFSRERVSLGQDGRPDGSGFLLPRVNLPFGSTDGVQLRREIR